MFDNFPLIWNIKMSQKLNFIKIQDGRQYEPHIHGVHGNPIDSLNYYDSIIQSLIDFLLINYAKYTYFVVLLCLIMTE